MQELAERTTIRNLTDNVQLLRSLSLATVALTLMAWHFKVTGGLSVSAVSVCCLFVFVCFAYGRIFSIATKLEVNANTGIVYELITGFFVFNTLMFLLALASPLGVATNLSILSLIGLLSLGWRWKAQRTSAPASVEIAGLIALLISGIAATIWCNDVQSSPVHAGQNLVYQVWQDVYIHVREISAFAQSHGISTIHDIKVAGAAAPIYHFASYIMPATIVSLTGATAMDVYASFQLPFGIFLTGLAAFSLIAAIWGPWAGVAAVVAVLVLPDGFQQGFGNRYLSYNFIAQVNPGMLYGIACISIAWIFVLEGCRRGKLVIIGIAYFLLVVCLLYKAHVFVANAFLIMIYPCIFFSRIKPRTRLIVGIVFTGIFFTVIGLSQSLPRVPILRLDGSGIGKYVPVLLLDFDKGILKDFFMRIFHAKDYSHLAQLIAAVGMLSLCTLGLWVAASVAMLFSIRKVAVPAVLAFPILVTANYLIMAIGLAVDTRDVGTPDELLNRPLVWAFFVVVAWTAGAGYHLVFGNGAPAATRTRVGAAILVCMAFFGTTAISKNLQTFPARRGYGTFESFNAVPVCLVKAAQFVREKSRPEEIIQDSLNDPRFVTTALAERQLYAGESTFGGLSREHKRRLDSLEYYLLAPDDESRERVAKSNGFTWYILHPKSIITWPESYLKQAVFECDGYRVFHFAK